MASTFTGIEMGKRSIITEQTAMKTTGHNISNANTEGYTRQRVSRETEIPLYDPSLVRAERPGQIGQGVEISKIERVRDAFIDDRILDEKGSQSYWKTRNDNLYHIELIHNEPGDLNIRSRLDEFWNSWEELANNPSEGAVRQVVRERAVTLASSVNHTWEQFSEMQKNVNFTIGQKVNEINEIAESIRQLNVQIQRSENLGDMPNDLYDRRDLLVEKLSGMADLSVSRRDEDEFFVFLGNNHLIQGPHAEKISLTENPQNHGFFQLTWGETADPVNVKSGELHALIELRDSDLDYQIRQLNSISTNLTDLVNEIHRDGFDLNYNTNLDFFKEMNITQSPNGDYDRNNDGVAEVTTIFKMAGITRLDPEAEIGLNGTITLDSNYPGAPAISIDYTAGDKVKDVIQKINNAQAEVVAYLNHNGQLTLKSTLAVQKSNMDFVIRHVEDSGDFLVNYSGLLTGSGPANAFDWNAAGQTAQLQVPERNYSVTPTYDPASWMDISASVHEDVNAIAAAGGKDTTGDGDYDRNNGVGDGSHALKVASLRYTNIMIGSNETVNDFYTAVIARTGTLAEQADIQIQTSDKLMEQLTSLRQSVSGVNLDEEMANLITFQHAYSAAARFITIQDRMLDTIIRMGM